MIDIEDVWSTTTALKTQFSAAMLDARANVTIPRQAFRTVIGDEGLQAILETLGFRMVLRPRQSAQDTQLVPPWMGLEDPPPRRSMRLSTNTPRPRALIFPKGTLRQYPEEEDYIWLVTPMATVAPETLAIIMEDAAAGQWFYAEIPCPHWLPRTSKFVMSLSMKDTEQVPISLATPPSTAFELVQIHDVMDFSFRQAHFLHRGFTHTTCNHTSFALSLAAAMVLLEPVVDDAPAIMHRALRALEAGLTSVQQLCLFQRFVTPATEEEELGDYPAVWPTPSIPSRIIGISTTTASLNEFVNLDRHTDDFLALFRSEIAGSESTNLHSHDQFRQTIYVLWPRGDVDTGYGHLVVRTGEGPTAGAIYEQVRTLTTQKACTETFIKKAASRNAKAKNNGATGEEDTDNEDDGAHQEEEEQGEGGEDAQCGEGVDGANNGNEG